MNGLGYPAVRYRQNAGKVKLSDVERGDPSSHPSLLGDGDDDDADDDDDQLPIDDFYHDQADEDAIPLVLSPPTKQVPLPSLELDEEGVRAGGARTAEGAAQTTTPVEEEVESGSDRARP